MIIMNNPKAYKPSPMDKVITIEVKVMLDAVPGAWHQPTDIMQWMCQHNYVQEVKFDPDRKD